MNILQSTLGSLFIYIGFFFITMGVIGLLKFKTFYGRILCTTLIDSSGFILVMIGMIITKGFSYFSLKIFLLLVTGLIIGPLTNHMLVRSAWHTGHKEGIDDHESDT